MSVAELEQWEELEQAWEQAEPMGAGMEPPEASAGAASAGLGGALQGAGASTVIPILGLAMGAMGAALKLLSSASGMYQNLMQGQQGTLGSMQYLTRRKRACGTWRQRRRRS